MKRRLLSMVLALVMVFSIAPATVFAEGAEAVQDNGSGMTIDTRASDGKKNTQPLNDGAGTEAGSVDNGTTQPLNSGAGTKNAKQPESSEAIDTSGLCPHGEAEDECELCAAQALIDPQPSEEENTEETLDEATEQLDDTDMPPAVVLGATTMTLNKTSVTLYLNEDNMTGTRSICDFRVENKPDGYKNTYSSIWSSDDESIATMSSGGAVTAQKVGTTTIKCEIIKKSTNKVYKTLKATVTVKENAKTVSITNALEGSILNVGESYQFKCKQIGASGCSSTDKKEWTVSDDTIRTIDTGLFTAKSPGKTTIQVKTYQSTATLSLGYTAESELVEVTVLGEESPSDTRTARPVITSPSGSSFVGSCDVEISCATEDATIYYTTDGTIPSVENGTKYSGAITLTKSTSIRAIAVKESLEPSTVATATFRKETSISGTSISGTASILGRERYGETLSVDTSYIVLPDDKAERSFHYQWKRNGNDIGDDSWYTITSEDIDSTITCTISHSSIPGEITATLSGKVEKGDAPVVTAPAPIQMGMCAERAYTFPLSTLSMPEDAGALSYTIGTPSDPTLFAHAPYRNTDEEGEEILHFTSANVEHAGGTATVEVTIHSDNYKDATVALPFEIVAKYPVGISGITVKNRVYNGAAITMSGTPSARYDGATVQISGYVYTWYDEDGTKLDGAPTNAGDYKLMISVKETDPTYFGDVDVPFTITSKPVTIVGLTATKEYDGTVYANLTGGTLSGVLAADQNTVAIDREEVEAVYDDATVGNGKPIIISGTFDLFGASAGNYTLTQPTGITGSITPTTLTVYGTGTASGIYGDKLNELTVSGLTVKFGETEIDGSWTVNGNTVPNAGNTATAIATFTPNSGAVNYNALTAEVTLNIAKATVADKASVSSAKFGSTGTLHLDEKLVSGATVGIVSVTDDNSVLIGTPTVTDSILTYRLANNVGKVGKTAEILIPVNESVNHKGYQITVTVTVLDKRAQTITAADVTATYGDTNKVVLARSSGNGAIGYEVMSGSDVISIDEATGKLTVKKVGEATVKVTAAETDDYGLATQIVEVKVKPKDITIKADDKTILTDKAKPDYTTTVTGLVRGESVSGISFHDGGATTDTKGSFTIIPSGGTISGGNDNYSITYQTGTLTVNTDVSSLKEALIAANLAKANVAASDCKADQVPKGTRFVTTAEMTALTGAMTAAKAAEVVATTTAEAQAAAADLNTAVTTFQAAIKIGTYVAPSGSSGSGSSKSGGGSGKSRSGSGRSGSDSGKSRSGLGSSESGATPSGNNQANTQPVTPVVMPVITPAKPQENPDRLSIGKRTTETETTRKPADDTDNEPSLMADNNVKGWGDIQDKLQTEFDKVLKKADLSEGENPTEPIAVTIDMGDTTILPKDVITLLQGKNIDLTLSMGDGIQWTINGLSVTGEQTSDINLGVAKNVKKIPVDIINQLTGEKYSIQIELSHNGAFGFEAVLTIDLSKDNAGMYANLFYYNEEAGELEFINSALIDKDGSAALIFTHASAYTIVVNEEEMGETPLHIDDTAVATQKTLEATEETAGNMLALWIALGVVITILIGGAVVYFKKKCDL